MGHEGEQHLNAPEETTAESPRQQGDRHWLSNTELQRQVREALARRKENGRDTKEFDTFIMNGAYVKMPDGVHLAVDIFLPSSKTGKRGGNSKDLKFPTVLHFTRYNRNWEFKKGSTLACSLLTCGCCCGYLSKYLKMGGGLPGTGASHWNMRSAMYTEQFLPAGFAWVTVDVRGTGASEGGRPIDFHSVELADTKFLAEWVTQQTWCDGRIYSTGISYDGMSALALTSHQLPAVKAIAPLFAPLDLMDELSHPGGIRCIGFTREYSRLVHHLERNVPHKVNYPPLMKFLIKLLTKGVRPVETSSADMQGAAIAGHTNNWDMIDTQRQIMNRDDPAGPVESIDEISIHTRVQEIVASETEHLAVSGWYDSGTALGAVRYYLSVMKHWTSVSGLRHPRLLLGPWNHGARNNSSPFSKTDKPSFPLVTELLRFFTRGDLDDEFPVHYFTVGEEAWKSCHVWPPPHEDVRLNIEEGPVLTFADDDSPARSLAGEVGQTETDVRDDARVGCTSWKVNTDSTSGVLSRWNLVQHIFKKAITYPNRKEEDKHNLVMISEPLKVANFEVTGHPHVTLYLQVDAEDASVFVYLEEVFPDGRVVYVTEGQLRLAQRKIGSAPSASSSLFDFPCLPYRSFLQKDCHMLQRGVPVRAIIPFFPISYAFSCGSRIRLSIALFDRDNFEPVPGPQPTQLKIFHGLSYLNLTHIR